MLTRRTLFGALAGAVAAACGWKAKPAAQDYLDAGALLDQHSFETEQSEAYWLAPDGVWPIKEMPLDEYKRLYSGGEPTPLISPAWVRAHTKPAKRGK